MTNHGHGDVEFSIMIRQDTTGRSSCLLVAPNERVASRRSSLFSGEALEVFAFAVGLQSTLRAKWEVYAPIFFGAEFFGNNATHVSQESFLEGVGDARNFRTYASARGSRAKRWRLRLSMNARGAEIRYLVEALHAKRFNPSSRPIGKKSMKDPWSALNYMMGFESVVEESFQGVVIPGMAASIFPKSEVRSAHEAFQAGARIGFYEAEQGGKNTFGGPLDLPPIDDSPERIASIPQ